MRVKVKKQMLGSMVTAVLEWTEQEQDVARRAFDKAHSRAVLGIIRAAQAHASRMDSVEECWKLHDFLSIQRHEIEGRFDFRLAGLLFVFASLVKDGLLQVDELDGLDRDKLSKIAAMSRM
ncbi:MULTISPECIES: hypothetical protein [unclassified Cyanobium]|uniref:hypothetical protein n=1 Tax=unclassified Cyanobium TaxID=2627006 RepID=UPI0020CC5DD0|nr:MULTISPECIES: hypothetical protein [unclassified Cyanobium]